MWGMRGDERPTLDTFYSPFIAEWKAGYERWLSGDKTNWYSLLSGAESGVGIHAGQIFECNNCVGYYHSMAYNCVCTQQRQPYLYPTAVQWCSIIDPSTNMPYQQLVDFFDIDYPCVGIQRVYSPLENHRWAIDNLQYESNADRFDYEVNGNEIVVGNENNKFHIVGVVPIWTVMPLKEEYYRIFESEINSPEIVKKLEGFNDCWCSLELVECTDECSHAKDYRQDCDCDARDHAQQLIEEIYVNPPVIEEHLSETSAKIWSIAQDAFYRGWQTVYDLQDEGSNRWAYLLWQQQSPFLDSPGQRLTEQETLTDSTSLETSQESSLAS